MTTLELPKSIAPALDAIVAVDEPYEGVYLVGGTVRDILLGERELRRRRRRRGRRDRTRRAPSPGSWTDASARTGSSAPPSSSTATTSASTSSPRAARRTTRRPCCPPWRPARSRRTSTAATSRSTRWRSRSRARTSASSSTRSRAAPTSRPGGFAFSTTARFIDDPTRILRAIRYEDRYGFRMDEHTVELARQCIATGHVGDLSGARLRDELIALLEEGDVEPRDPPAGRARSREGGPPARRRRRRGGRPLRPPPRAERALRPRRARAWRLGLEALGRKLPPAEIATWLDGAQGAEPGRETRSPRAIAEGPQDRQRSRTTRSPRPTSSRSPSRATRRAALRARPHRLGRGSTSTSSGCAASGSRSPGRTSPSSASAESPRVGEILGELRRRKLNGELDGRESELAAARELVGEA